MIVTATPAPALDVTITVNELSLGHSQRISPAQLRAGGKGVNVSRVLKQQGEETRAVVLAPPTGPFADELVNSDIPAVFIDSGGAVRTSYALVEIDSGRVTNLNEIAIEVSAETAASFFDAIREQAHSASVLAISGSLPAHFPVDALGALVAELRGAGVFVIVDSAPEALLAAARAGASVLKPNEVELEAATGKTGPAGARELIAAGAGAVLLSRGEAGVLLLRADSESVVAARLAEPLRGNPTGAGDAAVAALAMHANRSATPLDDDNVENLLRDVVSWSASSVLEPLAGSLHASVYELRERVVIKAGAH